jgi:multidrug efflux pump subunit AcrA (membrane-fusion protein)
VVRLENVTNVLYTGRVADAQPDATVSLFRLEQDGVTADRVPVKLGRISVNEVEIVSGLKEGDQIVLSDTSTWHDRPQIRIK